MEELYHHVKALFDAYHAPGHDFKHVVRVSKLARQIAEAEGYDPEEAEIAGFLHDVGRTVKDPQDTHAHLGAPIARELLNKHTNLPEEAKERIVKSIYVHSDLHTEGQLNNIVQDADKLDGMGAIGLNRAFASYAGKEDYDPDELFPDTANYGNVKTIHEGIVLVLGWYDMLYTHKAKELGKPRHEFLIHFKQQVIREIEESK